MQPLDYNTFAADCCKDLKILQEKFQKQYDLDSYENWFYNQATGLLTFSSPGKELNFRYFQVGSFSEKSQTWKWAWDNEDTLDKVKEKSQVVRAFGLRSGYNKLTDGYFKSDMVEAWEFTAIATPLTDGIGAYRPVSDHLQIFMVITEYVPNEEAQKIKDKYIECGDHEYRRITYVCRHLDTAAKVGFHEAFETSEGMELDDDDDLQAWCDECEKVREKEGEWNDNSMAFAQIKIVCEGCYFDMKEFNLGHR